VWPWHKKKRLSREKVEKAARATRNPGSRLFSNQKATPGGRIGVGLPDEPRQV
jgi:hypothetical protein